MSQVSAVREFNRFYTRLIGVLGEGLLDSTYSLTEARVLFELARADALEVVDLRSTLDLDPGYLSRVLGRFESEGLIVRSRSAADARRQVVALTETGRATQADLDARSAASVGALLDPLTDADRLRLLGAMGAIRQLLRTDQPDRRGMVVLRPPAPGDLGWIVRRHGELYAHTQGWDATFEAMVARIIADFGTTHDPVREALWIADLDGVPVGSVLCARHDEHTARLRVLLVEPSTRGLGLGTRLVDECLRFARRAGYRRIVLSTYSAMTEARRIYARVGFTIDRAEPVTAYGADLTDELWSLEL